MREKLNETFNNKLETEEVNLLTCMCTAASQFISTCMAKANVKVSNVIALHNENLYVESRYLAQAFHLSVHFISYLRCL